MLSNIEVNVKDLSSGAAGGTGTGIHVKIGIAGNGIDGLVTIRRTMDSETIKETLGESPLAYACMRSIDYGASLIYCIPVAASTEAKITEGEKTVTGQGTVIVSGNPCNEYDIVIRMEKEGGLNTATYALSIDGGQSYLEEATVPLSGKAEILGTGMELVFSATEGNFAEGDIFRFKASAPAMNNGDVLNAISSLSKFTKDIEFVHIVGTTTAALWQAIEEMAGQLEKEAGKPLLYVVEQRLPGSEETAAEYVESIKTDAMGTGRHLVVVQSCILHRDLDGYTRRINAAALLCGVMAASRESTSVAYVEANPLSEEKILKILPDGIEEFDYELDAGRYVLIGQYAGREYYNFLNSCTAARADSDYANIEVARVMYRIVREVYKRAQLTQNMDYDTNDVETALTPVQSDLNIPCDEAKKDQIISEGSVEIIMDEVDIQARKLPVTASIKPRGYFNNILLTFVCRQ